MDYVFDNATMYNGDRVYVVGVGPGTVIDTTAAYFRIRAAGRTIKVSYKGVQSGQSSQSVFWQNPIFCKPEKNDALWSAKRTLAVNTTNAFAQAVVGQEIIKPIEVEVASETNNPEALNSSNLQKMIAEAQAATKRNRSNNVTAITGSQESG